MFRLRSNSATKTSDFDDGLTLRSDTNAMIQRKKVFKRHISNKATLSV